MLVARPDEVTFLMALCGVGEALAKVAGVAGLRVTLTTALGGAQVLELERRMRAMTGMEWDVLVAPAADANKLRRLADMRGVRG